MESDKLSVFMNFPKLILPMVLLAAGCCGSAVRGPSDAEARRLLAVDGTTLVVVARDGTVATSKARGLRPLLDAVNGDYNLCGARCYDRVVGRAAAFLYVKAGAAAVVTPLASADAVRLLSVHGIDCRADHVVAAIRNRNGTDLCPMEKTVRGIMDDDVDAAVDALRIRVKEMRAQQKEHK